MSNASRDRRDDDALEFTVAAVWREARVTCPHPDVLMTWSEGGMDPEAAEFVEFHVRESQCPFCNAVLDDARAEASDVEADRETMKGMEDRLFRSTVGALRESS